MGSETMVTKIQKWGNSQGLRLARQVLEDAHLAVRDEVKVAARDGLIVNTPVRRIRGKQSLEDLVSKIPRNFGPQEADWGKLVGREVW